MATQRVCAVVFFALLGFALASGARVRSRSRSSSAIATASSSSGSSSGADVERLVARAFASAEAEGANAESIAQATAEEVGVLFAEAWAKAAGFVRVTGNGRATSRARASAQAQADIFGKAIAGAVADAVSGNNDASIAVDATQVATAIVEATASVEIELTTTGGFAQVTSKSVARVVAEVVVTAIADAIAFTVNDAANAGGSTTAEVDVDVEEQEVNGKSNVVVEGNSDAGAKTDASAVAEALGACRGGAFACCMLDDFCENYIKTNIGTVRAVQNKGSNDLCKC